MEGDESVVIKKVWNQNNFFISIVIGIGLIFLFTFLIIIFNITSPNLIILACFLTVIYAIILFFLLEPSLLKVINKGVVKTIEKPIVKEVIVEKPIQIVHETEKPIYILNKNNKRNINIPKYNFIGSIQTGVYHKKSCRLGRMIKKKYKIQQLDDNYFIKNKYRPCEICIKHSKKPSL